MLPNPAHLDHWVTSAPEPPEDEDFLEYLAEISDNELQSQFIELKGDTENV